MRVLRPVRLALLLLAVSPAAASAAEVMTSTVGDDRFGDPGVVTFIAAPGERNDTTTTLSPGDPRVVDVSDANAALQASGGCVLLDPHRARCTTIGVDTALASIRLGDGDDGLVSNVPGTSAGAGDGADHLVSTSIGGRFLGEDGNDVIDLTGYGTLDGGAGDDRLTLTAGGPNGFGGSLSGGIGRDVLRGGDRPDRLSGGPGADDLDGGPGGGDHASWAGETRSVHVDLAAGRAQAGADVDTLTDVESARGGLAADTLLGDEGANRFSSAFRRDRRPDPADLMDGRGGDDVLNGFGHGPDRLRGGAGDDDIWEAAGDWVAGGAGDDTVRRGGRSQSCGTGFDRVEATSVTLVARDCERIVMDSTRGLSPVRRSGGGLALTLADFARRTNPFKPCGVVVRVSRRGGPLLATLRARYVTRRAVARRLSVTRTGRRALGAHRTMSVAVTTRIADACPAKGAWRTRASHGGGWRQKLAAR